MEWQPEVIDICEQVPLLALDETTAIAEALGVRPPTDPKTQEPVVMTSDFLVTVRRGLHEIDLIRTVKLSAHLASKRVLEKLEIERRYWAARRRDWAVVTEEQIPRTVAKNVEWLHPFLKISGDLAATVDRVESSLREDVLGNRQPLTELTTKC